MTASAKKRVIFVLAAATVVLTVCAMLSLSKTAELDSKTSGNEYIKWVDFGVTAEAMNDALSYDVETYGTDAHIGWVDILSYLGAKYGGNFSKYKKSDADKLKKAVSDGKTVEQLELEMKFLSYYREAYGAVLGGFVGNFTKNGKSYYGLRSYSPIAAGYYYEHYDDFGAARSYGYKREHLGHDLMGSIGTPVIAVESGYVEAIGWNQYGGWRIGIRSFDNKRYYYYAHLRKDHPYTDIKEGDIVSAGDVIGYLGMTGYSVKENVNNINVPHLHFGIQLIFDVSQKDGNNQIWIDCYEITKFLYGNRMAVVKDTETNEYVPADDIVIYDIPD